MSAVGDASLSAEQVEELAEVVNREYDIVEQQAGPSFKPAPHALARVLAPTVAAMLSAAERNGEQRGRADVAAAVRSRLSPGALVRGVQDRDFYPAKDWLTECIDAALADSPATDAPVTHDDHPPCCTSCGGRGGTASGPCWDCRGTGHPHPTDAPATHDAAVKDEGLIWECAHPMNAWGGHDARCRQVRADRFDRSVADRIAGGEQR